MIKIKTDGFDNKSKLTIAKDYIIPKAFETVGMKSTDVIFNDKVINNIIEEYTNKEKGVRNLKLWTQ